jgi:hypothetical protein
MVDALRSSGDEIIPMALTSIGYFFASSGDSAISASFVSVPMRTPPSASSLM